MSPAPPFLFLAQAALREQPRYLVFSTGLRRSGLHAAVEHVTSQAQARCFRRVVAISFYLADAVLFGYRLARFLLEFVS